MAARSRRGVAAVMIALTIAVAAGRPAAGSQSTPKSESAILRELAAARSKTYARLLVGVWIPRLGGDTFLDGPGVAGDEINLDIELDLDDIEPTANFELTLAKDMAAVHLSGFSFSTSNAGSFTPRPFGSGPHTFGDLTLEAGDPYRAELDLNSAAAELQMTWLAYEAGFSELTEDTAFEGDARLSVVPAIAARWLNVEQTIESGASRAHVDEAWLALLAGLAVDIEWQPHRCVPIHEVRFQTAAAIGPAIGGDGGYLWQLRAGISVDITTQFSAMFGYRLVEAVVENDAYEFEAGLQGLFFAGSIRF